MDALVIYDSKFGNTERIARAIGATLSDELEVGVQSVDERPVISPELDLLVIGGPTHAHGLSEPMRVFLAEIPDDALRGVRALAFDTRFRMHPILSGRAAPKIARALRKHGAELILPPESFFVSRSEGHPLESGEEQRAKEWAKHIPAPPQVAV